MPPETFLPVATARMGFSRKASVAAAAMAASRWRLTSVWATRVMSINTPSRLVAQAMAVAAAMATLVAPYWLIAAETLKRSEMVPTGLSRKALVAAAAMEAGRDRC